MINRPKRDRLGGGTILIFCAIAGAIFGLSTLGKLTQVPPPAGAAQLHPIADAMASLGFFADKSSAEAMVVFTQHIQTLAPAFEPEMITKSDPPLPSDHVYRFGESENAVVDYEVRPNADSKPKSIAAACLNEEEIEKYAGHLQRALYLPKSAESVILIQLLSFIPENGGRALIEIADPTAIASVLPWVADGKPAQIARIFFLLSGKTCDKTNYALPPLSIKETLRNQKNIGYEIGVWK